MKTSFVLFILNVFSGFVTGLQGQELRQISHEKYGFGFECVYTDEIIVADTVLNEDILAVYKRIGHESSLWPMAGHYVKSDRSLCFYPAFGLPSPETYLIRYLGKEKQYTAPVVQKDTLPIALENIFPVGNEIPENTLCFYVKFNQEMQADPNAYLLVDLLDENGKVQNDVWRQRSFWFENNRILVLMLHPGRVKHGIAATGHLPKLLRKGSSCSLRLKPGLKSMSGLSTDFAFEKHYTIGEADRQMPLSPELLNVADLQGKKALQVRFNEAMDIGVVYKHLRIENEQGEWKGQWETNDGVNWRFIPDAHWVSAKYHLVFSTKLADLARNELLRLFEPSSRERFEREERMVIPFELK